MSQLIIRELNERNIFKHSHDFNLSIHSLSTLALDLFYTIICQIKNEDQCFNQFIISISDLEKRMHGSNSDYRINRESLKKAIKDLMNESIEFNTGNDCGAYQWFNSFFVSSEQGYIHFEINDQFKEHLLQLDKYVKGNLVSFLNLKSVYSKRIYLIMCQYASMGHTTVLLEDLNTRLQTPDSLKTYSNFKARVLETAKKEINEFTELNIEYKAIKIGRSVNDIKFSIKRKIEKVNTNNSSKAGITAAQEFIDSSQEEIIDIEVA